MTIFKRVKSLFSTQQRDAELQKQLEDLRKRTPVPVFWLFGKTQTGKTSIIKFLTGAAEAEIGQGFRPCTTFSRQYEFPNAEAPLLTFLDTRGVDEPGYDPAEDIARFDTLAQVVVVTVKVMDHALENIERHLHKIRRSKPERPVVLAVTCLHEAYPQQQHQLPYEAVRWDETTKIDAELKPVEPPDELKRSLDEQRRRFAGLFDYFVPIDLTPAEEGYNEPNYGGARLKEVLLEALPGGYRQTLITLDQATRELSDLYGRHAMPRIIAYASLAATAGAIPIPFVDLLLIPGIQTRMIYDLAGYYGQPLSGERFLELASTLGLGMVVRQATRELAKLIPFVGSVLNAALAGASTVALGKAFCYYYSAVHRGQVPKNEDIKRYYHEQLALAEKKWRSLVKGKDKEEKTEPATDGKQG
jgi:uncharacterized protein (DUF697 family)/predicted GTPase